eukprot:4850054-Alexandrium_andersonii.AAC.1
MELSIKLDWTKKPPWVFAHLAVHDNDGLARRVLQRVLSDYDAQPPALQQHHHRLTHRILRPDYSLRSELQQYLDGVGLPALPGLQFVASLFRFVPVVERYYEASHSLIKRMAACGSKGPSISLVRRLYRLEQDLKTDPSLME